MVETMGLGEARDAVLAAVLEEGPDALERVTSDELVAAFAIAGTPEECAEQLCPYQDVLDHVVLHTPYVPPITAPESAEAFSSMVKHLGRAG